MEKKKDSGIKKPGPILYNICAWLSYAVIRILFKFKRPKPIEGLEPPFVVLANHTCNFDFMVLASSIYPIRANYVIASRFSNSSRIAGAFFKVLRTISKYQFQPDLGAIRKMVEVIRIGGVLAMYPYGQRPYHGSAAEMPPGLGKLLKLLKCDVVAVKTDGGSFTNPKWAKYIRRGLIDVDFSRILTKEEIADMDSESIEELVKMRLMFNDYEWNREKQREFRGKKLAEGIEKILYKCPKCKTEYSISATGDIISCSECTAAGTMLATGFIKSDDFIFDNPYDWVEWQRQEAREEAQKNGVVIAGKGSLEIRVKNEIDREEPVPGLLALTKDGLTFESAGGHETKHYSPTKLGLVANKLGRHFEIGDNSAANRFIIDNPLSVMKWILACEAVYDLFMENKASAIRN
ncbi:MAG: 1-acyl-sn-glycerol-3-phosphate acyltransferase [Eubacteriaceae bacterium]|nr:1-acyl-sn-glycerol-3-phosphate acyltransferase [Eubacteriaceae bacterium]